jgi:hypothetical protein
MSRAGYHEVDDCDHDEYLRQMGWQANVRRCIAGRKGQAFLWELYQALEALPRQELITGALVNNEGCACALGAVALKRGVEIPEWMRKASEDDEIDEYEFADAMGPMLGIKDMLAREIMYVNDELDNWHWADTGIVCHGKMQSDPREVRYHDTPHERWMRVRRWVVGRLRDIP